MQMTMKPDKGKYVNKSFLEKSHSIMFIEVEKSHLSFLKKTNHTLKRITDVST